MFDEDNGDIEEFLSGIRRDATVSNLLQKWIKHISILRPILKAANLTSEENSSKIVQTIMNSLRGDGVEISVEEAESYNSMIDKTIDLLDIFDKNIDVWEEQGKTVFKNRLANGEEDDDIDDKLRDLLGF